MICAVRGGPVLEDLAKADLEEQDPECTLDELGNFANVRLCKTTDQARPEADPCRSANPIQGHCHHW